MQDIEHDQDFFTDPHRTYARLRVLAPVVQLRDPNGFEYWLVTRYRQAREALEHPALSKDPRHAWTALRDAGLVSGTPGDAVPSMLTADLSDHTRLRAPVARALASARMRSLRARVQDITDRLLDELAGAGTTDLIGAFAFPLSITVLCEILGVPVEDRDDFRTWTTAAHTPTYVTTGPMPRQQGARRLRDYVTALVARRRAAGPSPDDRQGLVDALVADRASPLTDAEIVETVSHLLLAGQDATTNLIGNGVAALLDHPDQFALLRTRPELVELAVEELLRYDGPTARSSPRFATADITLGSAAIPAGSVVIVGLSAANRDPDRFADPDRLDITRTENPHLAFGSGSHFCVAATLARSTGRIALASLVRRFPRLTLASPADQLHWRPTPVFRGLTNLPVHPAPAEE
jgi:cytochrome P450